MKMNKLRLTNVIENHFYLDFNWKDGFAPMSVSLKEVRRMLPWSFCCPTSTTHASPAVM